LTIDTTSRAEPQQGSAGHLRASVRAGLKSNMQDQFRERLALASPAELEELKLRALAVLERVQAARKYRLRSKVEEVEAAVAIETLVQVEAVLGRRGRWLLALRRLQLRMKYLR
jgi:hypothetical protein